MAIVVMIMGESGSGKSRALKFFKKGEVSVINVSKKPFPFRAEFGSIATSNYQEICTAISKTASKSIVIDDSNYLITFEFMNRASERGFDKYSEMASNFYNLIQFCINKLPNDKIVYFIGHTETDATGKEKFKTIGKMLDEKITLEGLFSIVLKTKVNDGVYSFLTKTNGNDTVKTPEDMFESFEIENNLKFVDDKIREFYGLTEKPAN